MNHMSSGRVVFRNLAWIERRLSRILLYQDVSVSIHEDFSLNVNGILMPARC